MWSGSPSRLTRGEGKYCSKSCQTEASRHYTNCQRCGKQMRDTQPSKRAKGQGKFCSIRCRSLRPAKPFTPSTSPLRWMRKWRARIAEVNRCLDCKVVTPKHKQRCTPCRHLRNYETGLRPKSETKRAAWRRAKERRKRRRELVQTPYRDEDIFRRDKYRCHFTITGQCVMASPKCKPHAHRGRDDWAPTIDHIIPLSQGGPDTPENVACAHRKCNWYWADRGTVQLRWAA